MADRITDEQPREWANGTEPWFWAEDRPMQLMAAELIELRSLLAEGGKPGALDSLHIDPEVA
ncbi:hypothetical protein AB0L97_32820 [Nocardia sp. NPDC051911]|uniref:hypothetical protein n=1 Tax=Nocardia sp. NPDC051911 TaxID=3154648 RepID=UPI003412C2BE